MRGLSNIGFTQKTLSISFEDVYKRQVHALHDTVPEITKEIYRNGDKVRVPDEEAIQEAATKIQ